jgi:hypothetical protein
MLSLSKHDARHVAFVDGLGPSTGSVLRRAQDDKGRAFVFVMLSLSKHDARHVAFVDGLGPLDRLCPSTGSG